jgi:hypothetical protein
MLLLARRIPRDRSAVIEAEAADCREPFFGAFTAAPGWQRRVGASASQSVGRPPRRRILLAEDGPDRVRFNASAPGTVADGVERALALPWERRRCCPSAARVFVTPDEIAAEHDAGQAETGAAWLQEAMTHGMASLLQPVLVEITVAIGSTWGEGDQTAPIHKRIGAV